MKKQNHLVFVRKKTNAEVCTPGGKEKATKVHASTSICRVAKAENMSRWTVQNLYGYHLRIDRMKIQFVQMLLPNNFNTRHWFPLQFLARREVDTECPCGILWTDEANFYLAKFWTVSWILTATELVYQKIRVQPHRFRCSHQK